MDITTIRITFADNLFEYLHINCKKSRNEALRVVKFVKSAMTFAVRKDYIEHNRLVEWNEPNEDYVATDWLTEKELNAWELQDWKSDRLEKVADLFMMQCYTGLNYSDLMNLKDVHFKTGEEGAYIEKPREKRRLKNNKQRQITPLTPKLQALFDKYNGVPKLSNPKYNLYLKECADILEIRKLITTRVARKTYAMLLAIKKVSPLIISRSMGHTTVTTTEKYYIDADPNTIISDVRNVMD